MVNIDDVVVRILRERGIVSEQRSLLVGISGIDGDLVVGGVAVLDAEVEGEERQVEIRLD